MTRVCPRSALPIRLLAVALLIFAVSSVTARGPAFAAPITPQAALVRVLTVAPVQAAWFAPSFLAQVSVSQIQQVKSGLFSSLGAYKSLSATAAGTYLVRFQHGTADAKIHLDGSGRIDGLWFGNLHAAGTPAATTVSPKAALTRLFSSALIAPEWFAPSFLAKISVAQIQQVIGQLEAGFGTYKGVDSLAAGAFRVRFQYGAVTMTIHLDGSHRISGLEITTSHYTSLGRAAALRALQHLPGQVSLLALTNGRAQLEINADHLLAVGSAFKLAVMAALQQRIATHHLSWNQKITLLAGDKSLPSGTLQTRPTGSTYTIADVARSMISISDNTAANMLIRVVGRSAIDAYIPVLDRPILTTREAFVLMDPANRALRTRYLAAKGPAARLTILPAVDKLPLPSASIFGGSKPLAPKIEWFFSSKQLCTLMGDVAALPQMSINPGLATPADWKHVAYKGGSDMGVINLTTQVTSRSGAVHCVSATWNNTSKLDEAYFFMLYTNLLNSFR